MNISILDALTLGSDVTFEMFEKFGNVRIFQTTPPKDVEKALSDADVAIVNKIKLNESNLKSAEKLKLICVTATGFDNIDIEYCKNHGIGVCNVCGYSTDSVAQLTVATALSLVTHLFEFDGYVKSGEYTKSGVQNCLTPVFHEIAGMTWGIIGTGNIGRKTAQTAQAMGADVIAYSRTKRDGFSYVDLDELCERADIISIHLPLNDGTRNIISRERIALMKNTAVLVNVARGAVMDEAAAAEAVIGGKIGGLGVDVYSTEPMAEDSPYRAALGCKNVIFTPHMAWGAYEARVRCLDEIAKNIDSYLIGGMRNRVV